ncbi:MAG: GNAT family N-acetyltransferase [Shimia sp.]
MTPTLTTEQLTLRAHRRDDFDAFAGILAAPIARYMGGPYDRRGAWSFFTNDTAGWVLHGHGAWAIERDGRFIGQTGTQWPDHYPEPEFGWLLIPNARGYGFATEAARTAMGWLFAHVLDTVVSFVDPDNTASQRVAERLGGTPDPKAWREDADDIVYRHTAESLARSAA